MTAQELAERLNGRRSGKGWIARCPAHDDRKASLSISVGDTQPVVLHCHAGCDSTAILAAVELEPKHILADQPPEHAKPKSPIVVTYDYGNEDDEMLYQAVRYEPKDFRQRRPDGQGGWIWKMGDDVRRVIYRLPDVRDRLADESPTYRREHHLPDDVFIVEGEKDADLLMMRGLIATTNVGGAGKWREEYTQQIKAAGTKNVVVLPDNDAPGRRHAADVARSCHAAGLTVKVVELPGLSDKADVSDFLARRGVDPLAELLKIVAAAPVYRAARKDTSSNSFNSSAPPWPEKLGPQAYIGVAGELVRVIEPHSEADPAALLIQILAMFGSCVGRTARFRVESDDHHTNLFAVLVGDTGKGRKGTSKGRVLDVFRGIDEKWVVGRVVEGLSSGEGLIWQVRDAIERTQPVKESGRVIDYQTVLDDPGVSDKRLLVMESEFASTLRVMAREGNTLSPVIRRAWDGQDLQVLTKNSPARATAPHISIVGHITSDELRRYLDRTESGNGFANRFLFVAAKRSKLLPDGGGTIGVGGIVSKLRAAVDHARCISEVRRDPEASALWHHVYERLSSGRPGLLGAVTARAEAQVMRLALLYALADVSPVIRLEHLRAALEIWRYCFASARYVFGTTFGDPVADEILRALRGAGDDGLTRTEISARVFGRNRSAEKIARGLEALHQAGYAYADTDTSTGGRHPERWRAYELNELSPGDERLDDHEIDEFNELSPDAEKLLSSNSFNSLSKDETPRPPTRIPGTADKDQSVQPALYRQPVPPFDVDGAFGKEDAA